MPNRPGAVDVTRSAPEDLERELEIHRRELTGYCYRMLGSGFEAEDAVQETLVRAWRGYDSFEGRAALRSWLYRIATNVCLDMLRSSKRRAMPMDLGPSSPASTMLGAPLVETTWVSPIADVRVMPTEGDPADLAEARESIRLAFIAALQHLPARQRAVLILRDVLRWSAAEVSELLETSVVSVNSALQRARATLASCDLSGGSAPIDEEQRTLLARYVDAFERYDISELVSLIRADATFSMPPFDLWLRGTDDIAHWYTGQGASCENSRLLSTHANGRAAFGAYKSDGRGGHSPFALQVIEVDGDKIVALHHFLDPNLFPEFGLPTHLDD